MLSCKQSYHRHLKGSRKRVLAFSKSVRPRVKSRPLGASGRGMLLSEQGRHELWAQEGQTSQVSIRVGPLCVWVVVNGRKGHHLTFLTSCSMLCLSRSPLDPCVSSTRCCIRQSCLVLFGLLEDRASIWHFPATGR